MQRREIESGVSGTFTDSEDEKIVLKETENTRPVTRTTTCDETTDCDLGTMAVSDNVNMTMESSVNTGPSFLTASRYENGSQDSATLTTKPDDSVTNTLNQTEDAKSSEDEALEQSETNVYDTNVSETAQVRGKGEIIRHTLHENGDSSPVSLSVNDKRDIPDVIRYGREDQARLTITVNGGCSLKIILHMDIGASVKIVVPQTGDIATVHDVTQKEKSDALEKNGASDLEETIVLAITTSKEKESNLQYSGANMSKRARSEVVISREQSAQNVTTFSGEEERFREMNTSNKDQEITDCTSTPNLKTDNYSASHKMEKSASEMKSTSDIEGCSTVYQKDCRVPEKDLRTDQLFFTDDTCFGMKVDQQKLEPIEQMEISFVSRLFEMPFKPYKKEMRMQYRFREDGMHTIMPVKISQQQIVNKVAEVRKRKETIIVILQKKGKMKNDHLGQSKKIDKTGSVWKDESLIWSVAGFFETLTSQYTSVESCVETLLKGDWNDTDIYNQLNGAFQKIFTLQEEEILRTLEHHTAYAMLAMGETLDDFGEVFHDVLCDYVIKYNLFQLFCIAEERVTRRNTVRSSKSLSVGYYNQTETFPWMLECDGD